MRIVNLVVALSLAACSPVSNDEREKSSNVDASPTSQATLKLQALALDDSRVQFTVATTLPTPIEISARVSLKGQAPKDTYVGYDEKVTLTKQDNVFILNTDAADEALPSGTYEAEVSFYPKWGADSGNPAAKQAPELHARSDVSLRASGQKRENVEKKNKLQRWVMGNLGMNEPWNLNTYEEKLGKAEKGPSTLSRLHDTYYFPDADVTLIVNRLKNEVTIWRLGDKTE